MRTSPVPMPFVVGLGRSGTTLLRLMLDAHPEVAVPPEQGWLPRAVEAAAGKNARRRFFRVVTRRPAFADSGLDPQEFWAELRAIRPFDVSEGTRGFYRLYAARLGKARFGDKTPPYRSHMPLIEGVLPEARFVHLVRDGRDVALSRRGLWFESGETIEDIARTWRETVEDTRAHGRRLRHYTEVRYEDLIADPERELGRLCRFADLEYDPAMLRYHEGAAERLEEIKDRVARGGEVRSTKEQRLKALESSTRPPDAGLAGRWKRDMSEADARAFGRVAGDLLRDLGYEAS